MDALTPDPHLQPQSLPNADWIVELARKYGCTVRVVAAGTTVLQENAVATSLYVVRQGILGAVVHAGPRALILHAFVENDVFTCMESFLSGGPSVHAIQALTQAEYVEIPREVLEQMRSVHSEVGTWLSAHHRLWISRMTKRIIELATASPSERYLRFLDSHPELMSRLPQYAIASILGISPESLSRVRKRLVTRQARH